jgi:hypothetical protein
LAPRDERGRTAEEEEEVTKGQQALFDELVEAIEFATDDALTTEGKKKVENFIAGLELVKPPKGRLTRMLNRIDKFLSNHDGSYKEDARALWHIIGGATRGPDDEQSTAKNITINLRGIAFPRTAKLGTGTGAAFTYSPQVPKEIVGLGHFRQHAQKALDGLRRAGRIDGEGQVKG